MHLNNSKTCAAGLDMIHFDKTYEMANKISRKDYRKVKMREYRKIQRVNNEDALKKAMVDE